MSEVFLKILNMSISASWLILAVFVIRFFLRKAPKWVNVLLWGIVAVRLLCPFSLESTLSMIPNAETIPMDIAMDQTPTIHTGSSIIDNAVNPMLVGSNTPAPGASINPLQITIAIYANIWFLGVLVMAIYTAVSYFRLHRRVATAIPMGNGIYRSENVASPFVLGIVSPRIYLPAGMEEPDLSHVIAHERAHIQRKDHWWKPLGFFLLTLHWFNPLMWLAYSLLCRDIELACDEKVIEKLTGNQKADYSQALLSCAVNRRSIAACPLAFGEVGVKERVKNVLNYKKPAFWIVLIAVVSCIAVAVCFLTDPKTDTLETATFHAKVIEYHGTYLLVEPVEGSVECNSADRIEIGTQNLSPSLDLKPGDVVQIEYDGMIQETYPARIPDPSQVVRVSSAGPNQDQLEDALNDLKDELADIENRLSDLGITLSVENVTPTGLTLICTQSGGNFSGEIITGSMYWLEVCRDGIWYELPTNLESVIWTAIAYMVEPNAQTPFGINWSNLYGELQPGLYRISKEFAVSGQNGVVYSAEFTIE